MEAEIPTTVFPRSLGGSSSNADIWNAYNDAGLVVIICLKLEALLCELLATFCQTKPNADIALHYSRKYPNEDNMEGLFDDAAEKKYSKILRNRCKMALEDYIKELFEPTFKQSSWGSPVAHFQLTDNDHSLLSKINSLRYKVVHYGEETDDSAILGHLTDDERADIVSNYKSIVRESDIFIKVFPNETTKVGVVQMLQQTTTK